MKNRLIALSLIGFLFTGCVTVPKETVQLSETLEKDLKQLHNSNSQFLQIYFEQIEKDINTFVDEVYTPYIIHYVLKEEMANKANGKASIFTVMETAASSSSPAVSDSAMTEMTQFLNAANHQINLKRQELLTPIKKQELELSSRMNSVYNNAIYANVTLTAYLKSVQKVKASQQEALNLIGLKGADSTVTHSLIEVSDLVNEAVLKGKQIDLKGKDAKAKLDAISNKIKSITK